MRSQERTTRTTRESRAQRARHRRRAADLAKVLEGLERRLAKLRRAVESIQQYVAYNAGVVPIDLMNGLMAADRLIGESALSVAELAEELETDVRCARCHTWYTATQRRPGMVCGDFSLPQNRPYGCDGICRD